MRILCCGDRYWNKAGLITQVLLEHVKAGDVVVHGMAKGADTLAGKIAEGMEGVTVEGYPADWVRYKKAAGPIRNQQMLDSSIDLVLAFHENLEQSRGTKHMVTIARKAGIPVKVFP